MKNLSRHSPLCSLCVSPLTSLVTWIYLLSYLHIGGASGHCMCKPLTFFIYEETFTFSIFNQAGMFSQDFQEIQSETK